MRLPSFKRIIKTDYVEEFQNLVDTLASSLNVGIDNLYLALNKNLSLSDNVKCTIKDVTVTVNSSGIPIASTGFLLDFDGKCIGVQVLKYDNLTNSTTYPTTGVSIAWTQQNKSIVINHIAGLPANNQFLLKVVAYAS
jgi:hypothetical protein